MDYSAFKVKALAARLMCQAPSIVVLFFFYFTTLYMNIWDVAHKQLPFTLLHQGSEHIDTIWLPATECGLCLSGVLCVPDCTIL